MNLAFRESFLKDLKAIGNKDCLVRIQRAIESIREAENSEQISQIRKLSTKESYYRIRVGDYRIGLIIEGSKATFVRCLHRREIYRYFP